MTTFLNSKDKEVVMTLLGGSRIPYDNLENKTLREWSALTCNNSSQSVKALKTIGKWSEKFDSAIEKPVINSLSNYSPKKLFSINLRKEKVNYNFEDFSSPNNHDNTAHTHGSQQEISKKK